MATLKRHRRALLSRMTVLGARSHLQLGATVIVFMTAFSAIVTGSGCGGGGGGDAAMKEAEELVATHPSRVASTQELAALIESIASKCGRSHDDHPWGASEVADSIEHIMQAQRVDVMEAARAFDSVVPEDPATACDLLVSLITG